MVHGLNDGQRVKGFEFSSISNKYTSLLYTSTMDEYIGRKGVVIRISEGAEIDIFVIKFDDGIILNYPLRLWKKAIIKEEEKEESNIYSFRITEKNFLEWFYFDSPGTEEQKESFELLGRKMYTRMIANEPSITAKELFKMSNHEAIKVQYLEGHPFSEDYVDKELSEALADTTPPTDNDYSIEVELIPNEEPKPKIIEEMAPIEEDLTKYTYFKKALGIKCEFGFDDDKLYKQVYDLVVLLEQKGGDTNLEDLMR